MSFGHGTVRGTLSQTQRKLERSLPWLLEAFQVVLEVRGRAVRRQRTDKERQHHQP
jgi:hypothetical protein